MYKRIIIFLVCFSLILQQASFAWVVPLTGSAALPEAYRPLQLRSVTYDPAAEGLKLLIDKGDEKKIQPRELKSNTQTLLQYFLIGLTLPNDVFWVNLRPDAAENIIDPSLEKTDVGRILLEADVRLKKDVARYTSPQTNEGREYWDKLHKKAQELYGSTAATIPTLTRPWIVPNEIILRETKGSVYIYKATLKVMLERDYLKDSTEYRFDDPRAVTLNEYSTELIRSLILPQLTRDVNSSRMYAPLRQVYHSLVLAQWFKKTYKDGEGAYVSRIDTKDLRGLGSSVTWDKSQYYGLYKKSLRDGEYVTSENRYSAGRQSISTCTSGGIEFIAEPGNLMGTNPRIIRGASVEMQLPDNGFQAVSVAAEGMSLLHADGGSVPVLAGNAGNGQNLKRPDPYKAYRKFTFPRLERLSAETAKETGETADGGSTVPSLTRSELDDAIRLARAEPYLPAKAEGYGKILQSAVAIFSGYREFLNKDGVAVKGYFDGLSRAAAADPAALEKDFDAFRLKIGLIPRFVNDNWHELHPELFNEVFEGMSNEALSAFLGIGDVSGGENTRETYVSLMELCSNQCLFCFIRDPHAKKSARYIPFPMVMKLMSKLLQHRLLFIPYRESDPLEYYDPFTGASIAEICETAAKIGMINQSLITHGTRARQAETPGIFTRLTARLPSVMVSVHLMHKDVMQYALDAQDPAASREELAARRQQLVDKYVNRFRSLISAASRRDKLVFSKYSARSVLDYLRARIAAGGADGLRKPLAVLVEIESVQQEMYGKLSGDIPGYLRDGQIVWLGGAAQMLKELGLSDAVIEDIQRQAWQQTNGAEGVITPVIKADGSLCAAASEDPTRISRTVAELFSGPDAPDFRCFVEYLRTMLRGEKRFKLDTESWLDFGDKDLREFIAGRNTGGYDRRVTDAIRGGGRLLARYQRVFSSWTTLELPVRELLLSGEAFPALSGASAAGIFSAIKGMPVPIKAEFAVVSADGTGRIEFTHSFFSPENAGALKRNLYSPYRDFTLKRFRAFTLNSDRIEVDMQTEREKPASSVDGGMTPPLAGIELDRSVRAIQAAGFRQEQYADYMKVLDSAAVIFAGYRDYLNEEGVEVKRYFDRLKQDPGAVRGDFERFKEKIGLIPRIGEERQSSLHTELFTGVLEGVSDSQLNAFCRVGEQNAFDAPTIFLNLSEGCSNRCLFCAIRGWEPAGPVTHMPFPVAVKIMRRLGNKVKVMPYRESEPLEYYDRYSGATIADFLVEAAEMGMPTVLVTHGTNARTRPELAPVIQKYGLRVHASIHVFHKDAQRLAADMLDPGANQDALSKRREEMIEGYAGKIRDMFASVKYFDEIRVFSVATAIKYLKQHEQPRGRILSTEELNALRRAVNVLAAMDSIQKEVWERVKDDLPGHSRIEYDEIIWYGAGVRFLKEMGIPDYVIADMQESARQTSNLSARMFDAIINTDGSLEVAAAEDTVRITRPVGEIFSGPGARHFREFARNLGYAMKAGSFNAFLSLMFPEARRLLGQLDARALPDEKMAGEIYAAIRELPVPITRNVRLGDRVIAEVAGTLVDIESTDVLKRDLFEPYARYKLAQRAFLPGPGEERAGEPPRDGGKGGVDFKSLEPRGSAIAAKNLLPAAAIADPAAEWESIRKMISGGNVPSVSRIEEFAGACYYNAQLQDYRGEILSSIAVILRDQERDGGVTQQALRELLVLVEGATS